MITAVAGHRIASNTDLRDAIGLLRIGDQVTIDLLHDGHREQRRTVLTDALPAAPPSSRGGGAGPMRN